MNQACKYGKARRDERDTMKKEMHSQAIYSAYVNRDQTRSRLIWTNGNGITRRETPIIFKTKFKVLPLRPKRLRHLRTYES